MGLDSINNFEDLSGMTPSSTDNPYDALIRACSNDSASIQSCYDTHRRTRNHQQRTELLAPDFSGIIIDPILEKLAQPKKYPGYVDPRHCLVFWARPPAATRVLISIVQQKLRETAPSQPLQPIMAPFD
ncbi:transport between ER and Golgi ATPase protein [Schaereria dolodes]|nr:transport between ER and Golgi ATPase protein [Schaereria dolodes]